MEPKVVISQQQLTIIVQRLCKELIENHGNFQDTVIIGVQPRGIFFAQKIIDTLKVFLPNNSFKYGDLDVTFYRDDYRRREKPLLAQSTTINFDIEAKKVILVDDVFYTGRTIRAALDAILDYGRPQKVELLTLIKRRFKRHVPINPDYVGFEVDSIQSQKVKVIWADNKEEENKVLMIERD